MGVDDVKSSDYKKLDIYRDTLIRYLGYANEVGESFRPIIGSKWVLVTYGVATLYALADTVDKCIQVYNTEKHDDQLPKKIAYSGTDALIWQMLASVIVPGFTINRICAGSSYLLQKNKNLSKNHRQWLVIATGLAVIPFIVKPIDSMTDRFMDETYRKLVS